MRTGTRRFLTTSAGAAALTLVASMAFAVSTNISSVTLAGGSGTQWEPSPDYSHSDGACAAKAGYVPVVNGFYGAMGDAVDGGGYFIVGSDTYDDADGLGDLVGQSLTTGPTKVDGLRVSRTDTALAGSPTLRSVIGLKNPTRKPISRTVTWESEMGSDVDTEVNFSSSGQPGIFAANDMWVVTSDGTPLTDPPVTQIFYGPNDPKVTTDTVVHDGTDTAASCVTVKMKVTIPKRATRYLIFFMEMHDSISGTIASVNLIEGAGPTDPPFAGVGDAKLAKTLNWNLHP